MEPLRFLSSDQAQSLADKFGTPFYCYSESLLREQAKKALAFPNPHGLTVRYAMKAAPNATILSFFDKLGLHFDASSGYEVERLIKAGVSADKISLSTQEFPANFKELHEQGMRFNACSIDQLKRFAAMFPGERVGLRFNPGIGSGGTGKTNVGGPSSSFGIWNEWVDEVRQIVEAHNLQVIRIHTHIGSGSDPAVWSRTVELSLNLVSHFPTVETLNLGGGYKVGRMMDEVSTDLKKIGEPMAKQLAEFSEKRGQPLKLEIEPGTFLVANACALVTRVQDKVSTGDQGHVFLKLDSGMNELLRPSLYGAQHPVIIIPRTKTLETESVVVVGHCCESGDLVSPAPGEAETLGPRELACAEIGDVAVIEGTGAYCSSMSTINYNSFPQAAEVWLAEDGQAHLIRQRQTLDQIIQNEVLLP